MLWLRECLHWNAWLAAFVHNCCQRARPRGPLISADSFALLTFFSDVFRLAAACHTWVSFDDDRGMPAKWSRSVSSVSCHSQNADDTDATMLDPEGGRACGWPGWTLQTVDSASCCLLRLAELPFRQRVPAAFSPAARDSSSGSRNKLIGIRQRWCGLRTCKPLRITEGPGQRSLRWQQLFRHSLLLARRDLAALSLLVQGAAAAPAGSNVSCRKKTERVDMADCVGSERFLYDAPSGAVVGAAPVGSNVSCRKETVRVDKHYEDDTDGDSPSKTLNSNAGVT